MSALWRGSYIGVCRGVSQNKCQVKAVQNQCQARVSSQSVLQECQVRVSY